MLRPLVPPGTASRSSIANGRTGTVSTYAPTNARQLFSNRDGVGDIFADAGCELLCGIERRFMSDQNAPQGRRSFAFDETRHPEFDLHRRAELFCLRVI